MNENSGNELMMTMNHDLETKRFIHSLILTMSNPSMLALVTCPQVDFSRLETLTCAVYQSTANGLKNAQANNHHLKMFKLYILNDINRCDY